MKLVRWKTRKERGDLADIGQNEHRETVASRIAALEESAMRPFRHFVTARNNWTALVWLRRLNSTTPVELVNRFTSVQF